MDIVELLLDEDNEQSGIEAISVVLNPAIQSSFIALKNQKEKKRTFAQVNKEQRILMGAALIPNKPIYRKSGDREYYVYFSPETIKKASQLYLIKGNQSNATLEHRTKLEDLTIVESWIVEDPEMDKSTKYDLEGITKGTWMVTMKVNNDEIWNDFVKTNKVLGFSIEGFFSDSTERPKESIEENMEQKQVDKIVEILESNKDVFATHKVELKSSVAVLEEYTYELNKSTEDLMMLSTEAQEAINKGVKELTRVDAVNRLAKKKLETISEAAKELGVKIPQIAELQKAINGFEQQRKSLTKVLK